MQAPAPEVHQHHHLVESGPEDHVGAREEAGPDDNEERCEDVCAGLWTLILMRYRLGG